MRQARKVVQARLVNLDAQDVLEDLLDDLLVVGATSALGEEHVAVLGELLHRLDGASPAPPEQVAQRRERLLLLEDAAGLPAALELEEDVDRLLGVRGCDAAPAL